MIRLSLIIATYNRAASLLTALDSVARQEMPPGEWECVVVDNNSSDDTAARIGEFAAAHPRMQLRTVTERRQGLSFARNRGIAESRGEIVAIIDDDERIVPGFVAAYAEFFEAHPDAVAAGGAIVPEYPAGRPGWMSHYTEIPIANPIDLGAAVREFPAGRIPGGGNMALRRSAFERYGCFDTALGRTGTRLIGGEESDLFERLVRAGERIWYVPGAVMYHIIPPSKLTTEYFDRLCCNIGATQRVRAQRAGRYGRACLSEGVKWAATLAIACGRLLSARPAQAARLLRMRRRISKGLFGRA